MSAKRFFCACGVFLLALSTVFLEAAEAQAPTYLLQWGNEGSGPGQFISPLGIATDQFGNVYVTDYALSRVQKFTSEGQVIAQWGSGGTGAGEFANPYGITVDAAGYVYVADMSNHRIQKFTDVGTYVTQWGSYGSAIGQFDFPVSVSVDADGNVYVGEHRSGRIQKFTDVGQYITHWGPQVPGHFDLPGINGSDIDANGNLCIAQAALVRKFSNSGTWVAEWLVIGGTTGMTDAYDVAIDPSGSVYVSTPGFHTVQMFTDDGTFITQWGTFGIGNGEFNKPTGLATDHLGNVYVVDTENHRIQKFGHPPTSGTKAMWGSVKSRYRGERGVAQPSDAP